MKSALWLLVYVACFCLASGNRFSQSERETRIKELLAKATTSRFTQPWPTLGKTRFPSLHQSRNRIFHSSQRRYGSDGVGHGIATKNSEVSTALVCSLHNVVHQSLSLFASSIALFEPREPLFGSLTEKSTKLMEDFFGWGRREYSATEFRRRNCKGNGVEMPTSCTPCQKPNAPYNIVRVPKEITFSPGESKAAAKLELFLAQHNESFTIFEMSNEFCATSPTFSNFTLTRPWFRTKYWERHWLPSRGNGLSHAYALYGKSPHNGSELDTSLRSASIQDAPLLFRDGELSIAVHVRRGDFLVDKGRVSIKSAVYAQIIRTALDVVENTGGPFATMPAAVYIYSEGKPKRAKSKASFMTHKVDALTDDYIDETGVVRDASWWSDLIRRTKPQGYLRDSPRAGKQVKMPRVELRVSQSTVQTLHQMIAADVFVGSASGLSINLVKTLSRGVGIYPRNAPSSKTPCCFVESDVSRGFFNIRTFASHWDAYRRYNERYL